MAYQLNKKVRDLTPYDAINGDYAIRLDANESFFNPNELFTQEIAQEMAKVVFNRYPDASCKKLRESFAALYGLSPEAVVAGNGSDELITIIMGALLEAGDKLLTFAPDFSMYQFYGRTYEKQVVTVEKEAGLYLKAELAIAAIEKEQPQAVLFSNPCSPTSLVMLRREVVQILDYVAAHLENCLMIIDEAYMEFSDQSILDLAAQYDNVIVLKTCSKALGSAAIRLGFAVSSDKIIGALNAVRSPYNINMVTQAVGALLLSKKEYIKEATAKIIVAREELYENLKGLAGKNGIGQVVKPDTNFVYMQTERARELYDRLLERSIIVRQLGNALRITAGTAAENEAVTKALYEILEVSR